MQMLESTTASGKVLVMGAAPEPDEVKEMLRRIDEVLEILRIQNSLLCQILPQSAKMSSDLKELVSRLASQMPNLRL
jgi:hypothetical protein